MTGFIAIGAAVLAVIAVVGCLQEVNAGKAKGPTKMGFLGNDSTSMELAFKTLGIGFAIFAPLAMMAVLGGY